MAYRALYRKWRPLVFEDIVGQNHITSTLRNQIINNKIGHAYLFCGTRGTGKTTAAKIFARAVNCLNPQDGSPCNECDVCRGIFDGSVMDVTEIDAASNNSVDNIRELRDDTKYATAIAKYRVYIIDEVHMLSNNAFNALLKTLEEPPEHVIFILATTEAHKIPQTILSRCQRFDFKRIRPADIIARLKEIAHGDGLSITDDAYTLIARLGDGSMRDALSVLERVVSACGTTVTSETVTDTLSITDIDSEFNMAKALEQRNSDKVFELVNGVINDGRDLHVYMDNLITHFRNLLICRLVNTPENFLDYSSEEIARFKSQAELFTDERITNIINALSQAKAQCKWLKSPRVMYEVALIRLCAPELDNSVLAISDRLSAVEEKVKNGVTVKVEQTNDEEPDKKKEKPKHKPSGKLFNSPSAEQLTLQNPVVYAARHWQNMIGPIVKTNAYLAQVLINRNVTVDGDGIIMIFSRETEAFAKELADKHKAELQQRFLDISGVDCEIKAVFYDEIQDYIIDIWALPDNVEKKVTGSDPLDGLNEDMISNYDDSAFRDFDKSKVSYTQTDMDDDEDNDDSDAYLTDEEKKQMQND